MLTCIPHSICSWDYQISGAAGGSAAVTFNRFSAHGSLFLGGAEFSVLKHGWLSGHWTVERNGAVLAEARISSVFSRAFDIQSGAARFQLRPLSIFSRSFEIHAGSQLIGNVRPMHSFTRRAYLEASPDVPEVVQLFCFWLVAMKWRQASD
jgi:hypothetical protein